MNQHRSVFIATSLDGFIARSDGSIDWLNDANEIVPQGEDCGYAEFMLTVDALVMGRNTFEQVLTFGEWPYGSKPVIVLSRRLGALPVGAPETVSLSSETPHALIDRLASQGIHRLYVDGGLTIQSFIEARLIDEIIITVIPILLGSGKPLFGPVESDVKLQLVSSRSFDCGFVQTRYRVATGD